MEGVGRDQSSLLPAAIEDYAGENNPVRVIDAFVDRLDLRKLGFTSVDPLAMGRPGFDITSRRALMLICPAIGDTDPIRRHAPSPGGQFSGNILSEAMRPENGGKIACRCIFSSTFTGCIAQSATAAEAAI